MSALRRVSRTNSNQTDQCDNVIQLNLLNHYIIGHDQDGSFQINSIKISTKHVLLELCVGPKKQWKITDVKSRSGLYINGTHLVPIVQQHLLKDGDKLSFGPPKKTQFVYLFVQNYQSHAEQKQQQQQQQQRQQQRRSSSNKIRNRFINRFFELFSHCYSCQLDENENDFDFDS